ncbi:hypothetical protein DVK85_11430 [Flavobacterium arcticum]|uniref:Carboxypeptidase-like regulatory domain-containing protein n=1 Tax=Flavobacterium arcticum TaxID=1784713 RepID=A0A345HDZ7_9FLAO|nr:carboxypeptidase-like regulatory domain-containing protein [Flavobacterium arcticum]AXG74807.1 hypothetical protein DVK85_11430 [Flavobacterium arcticum]KAF2509695.1 hypothetical protein E0W72_09240 [Flavobacterium arcticum]
MDILEKRGIKFINEISYGRVRKCHYGLDSDMGYIVSYNSKNTLERIIQDIDLTLSGKFDLIDDPDISNYMYTAYITPQEIEYWDDYGNNIIGTCPLEDFRELVIRWKDFLETPPFDRSELISLPEKHNSVQEGFILKSSNEGFIPLQGAHIFNKTTRQLVPTDINGKFTINAQKGDTLEISYMNYAKKNIIITENRFTNIIHRDYNIVFEYHQQIQEPEIVNKKSFFGRIFHSISNLFR